MKPSGASEVVTFDRNKSTGDMVSTVWSPTAVSSGNSCYRFWSKRSSSEKTCILLIIFLLAVAITLSALLGVFVTWYQDVSAHHDNMCTSESCVISSASMIERIDKTIDPCNDFYRFACGSFIKSNIAPLGRTERTVLQDMQDQLYIEMKNLLEIQQDDLKTSIVTKQMVTNATRDSHGKSTIKSKSKGEPLNESRLIKPMMKSNDNDSSITTGKAVAFYKSCMAEDNDDEEEKSARVLIKLIQSSGGPWSQLQRMSGVQNVDQVDVTLEQHIATSAINQVESMINFYVAPANKNASVYSVHMYPGSGILDTFYLQNVTLLGDLSEEARSYISLQLEVIRLLAHINKGGKISTFTSLEEMTSDEKKIYEIIQQELIDQLNFESEMAILAKNFTSIENEDETLDTPIYTIQQLDSKYKWLNWTQLFTSVSLKTNVTIHQLVVSDTYDGYFSEFASFIKKYDSRLFHNYLSWCHVWKYISHIGSTFKKMYTDFRKQVPEILDTTTEQEPEFLFKWKECVHLTSESLKIPTTRLYIDKKLSYIIPIRHRTQEIVDNIRKSFRQIIHKQKWISSEQVKEQLIKRLETIETRVAFPNSLLNATFVNQLYTNLIIDENASLMVNLMSIAFHDSMYELNRVNKTVDSDMDWLLHPLVSNAYYDESSHSIILPIGMLQRPMVMLDRPKFLDYSTLGVVVGHELSHSLDKLTEGLFNQTLDTAGNISSQVSEHFINEYTNMTSCFIDQYSNYSIGSNWSVDGNLTLQENICDFAGLQQSYNAFNQFYIHSLFTLPGLTDYTPNQLFFIQHAQIWCEINTEDPEQDAHSPGQFRANGVLVNSKKFAQAFNCPVGSPMNPHDKCSLWSLD